MIDNWGVGGWEWGDYDDDDDDDDYDDAKKCWTAKEQTLFHLLYIYVVMYMRGAFCHAAISLCLFLNVHTSTLQLFRAD